MPSIRKRPFPFSPSNVFSIPISSRMNKLSPHKKKQLLAVAVGTVIVLLGLHYAVTHLVKTGLAKTQNKIEDTQFKLKKYQMEMAKADETFAALQKLEDKMDVVEESIP